MTPRALYRWKSFWLGVLVLAGLGWAWWLSYDYVSFSSYAGMGVFQQEGHVALGYGGRAGINESGHMPVERGQYVSELLPLPFFARGEGLGPSDPMLERELTFKEETEWYYSMDALDVWALFLPHWLLVAVFLGAWAGFLIWRVRCQRRVTKIDA